jgi:hypothetical protein
MTRDSAMGIRFRNRLAINRVNKGRLSVTAGVFFASGLLCWSVMVEGPQLTLAIAAIPLLLPFLVACSAARENGILDPTALFPAFFALYNGVLLMRFLSEEARSRLSYPLTFGPEAFFRAGVLSALSALFIAIAWAVSKRAIRKRTAPPDAAGWFTVGIALYGLGIGLYFLQYLQIGGYWAALAMNRVERYQRMTEVLSWPSGSFVLIGLAMMTVSKQARRGLKRATILLMTAVWCVIVMAQGERRMVLQAVLAVASAAMFASPNSVRVKLKHVVIAIGAYAAFSIAGELRLLIPYLASGKSLDSAESNIADHRLTDYDDLDFWLDSIKPEHTELAGPYLSVLYNAEQVRDYRYGSSYLGSIFAFLPRFLYPGTKPLSATEELDREMHRGSGPMSGWAYSPVAEAFLNFGLPGVCVISSLWMGAFVILSKLRNSDWGLILAAVLSSETVNANRIDFRTVYLESFFCIVSVLVAWLAIRVLYPKIHRIPQLRRFQLAR